MAKCLMDNCSKDAAHRGLCMADYTIALRLVKANKTTWNALEAAGRADKVKTSSKQAWFLASGTTKNALSDMQRPISQSRVIGGKCVHGNMPESCPIC